MTVASLVAATSFRVLPRKRLSRMLGQLARVEAPDPVVQATDEHVGGHARRSAQANARSPRPPSNAIERDGGGVLVLTELALDPPDATSDESGAPHLDENYLILSIIHTAKVGQERQAVTRAEVGRPPADRRVFNRA